MNDPSETTVPACGHGKRRAGMWSFNRFNDEVAAAEADMPPGGGYRAMRGSQ